MANIDTMIKLCEVLEENVNIENSDNIVEEYYKLASDVKMVCRVLKQGIAEVAEENHAMSLLLERPRFYTKKDIREMFDIGNEKALKILKKSVKKGYGVRLGNEYYINKEDLEKFLKSQNDELTE